MGDNKKIIQNAISFLGRVDLKGEETPAFAEVIDYLNKQLKDKEEVIEDKKK